MLDKLSADGTPDPAVVVQFVQTLSTKGVSTVDQDPRYLLAYVEAITAVVAKVEAPRLVVSLDNIFVVLAHLQLPLLFFIFFDILSFFAK